MPSIQPLTQFDFYAVIENTPGLSLVYFTAPSCSSCRHLSQLLTEMITPADLTIFNVDAVHEQALLAEYEVFHLPALFLFKQGQYHAEIHAEARSASILNAITVASQQAAEEAP
ncbi:MAG: thioredoxin family protein [Gammaproteobacteria bacterium]|nr:thioredoxin family protein [Gammaproteobacteria bacterium]